MIGIKRNSFIQNVNNIKKYNDTLHVNKNNKNQNNYNQMNDRETPTAEEKKIISKLKIREREVIAHEQAHKSVGGQFSGAMNYSYTTGPDGRRYVSGGEVGISIPGGKPSEKLIQDLKQVKRAALAPAKPSGQDMSVASSAESKIQDISSKLNKKVQEKYKKQLSSNKNQQYTFEIYV